MLSSEEYKNTLKYFASGVTVLSWRDSEQKIQGITVSAFSALSLQPPLVLFCINQGAYVYKELITRTHLAINILAANQQQAAYQFAGSNRENLEAQICENNPHQLPYLRDALANLSVRLTRRIAGGDHDIFIAELLHSHVNPARAPLIYHNGQF